MKPFFRILLLFTAAMALSAPPACADDLEDAFDRSVLIIETAESGCFKFDIYLAVSRKQQQRGLMFVRDLPQWSGMIFVYPQAGIRSMWMKNTYIPLDILFARADGSVSSVSENTEPLSLKPISAIEPINYVVELNAGTAARIGIGAGSRLVLDTPD